jgi:hypothetical protein
MKKLSIFALLFAAFTACNDASDSDTNPDSAALRTPGMDTMNSGRMDNMGTSMDTMNMNDTAYRNRMMRDSMNRMNRDSVPR